jgi:thermitase
MTCRSVFSQLTVMRCCSLARCSAAMSVPALVMALAAGVQASPIAEMPPEQQPVFASAAPGQFISGRLLISVRTGIGTKALRAAARMVGGHITKLLPLVHAATVEVPSTRLGPALERLHADPVVVDAERDPIDHGEAVSGCAPSATCVVPDDPLFASQWGLSAIDASQAWALTQGRPGVTVAIVDTGIDVGHPDLAAKIVGSATLTGNAGNVNDRAGHGTHVAGIVAAIPDNGAGIAGDGYDAKLLNLKASSDSTSATSPGFSCEAIAQSIVYAVQHNATVINLSLGSPTPCDVMATAVAYAWSHNVLLVAAAGNANTSAPTYPAAFPDVIAVAATDPNDQRASFSNHDAAWVDIAAPGVDILSTVPTYGNPTGETSYGYMSGTSMAAPFVAGAAALIWPTVAPLTPDRTNAAVAARLCSTADPIAGTGTDWSCGLLNLCQAAAGGASGNCTPPAAEPVPPGEPSPSPPTTPAPPTSPQPPPSIPSPPDQMSPGNVSIPQLTRQQAQSRLRAVLRQTFGARFTRRRDYRSRCERLTTTRFRCSVDWSRLNTRYYGTAAIHNTRYKESFAWSRTGKIHWIDMRCRGRSRASRRRCAVSTIRLQQTI